MTERKFTPPTEFPWGWWAPGKWLRKHDDPEPTLNIPWGVLDKKYKYAAMDEDGVVYLYDSKPYVWSTNTFWLSDGDEPVVFTFNYKQKGIAWERSLTKRPEGD